MKAPVEEVSDYQGLPLNQFYQMETSLEEGDKYEQIQNIYKDVVFGAATRHGCCRVCK